MRKNNKKGFTLAELLIVVAIIAVLVAIAIPIFTAQLEKSREATDVANLRDYYAEIAVAINDGSISSTNATFAVGNNLTATATFNTTTGNLETVTVADVDVNQTQADWAIDDPSVAGVAVAAPAAGTDQADVVYTFTTNTTGAHNTYLSGVAYN